MRYLDPVRRKSHWHGFMREKSPGGAKMDSITASFYPGFRPRGNPGEIQDRRPGAEKGRRHSAASRYSGQGIRSPPLNTNRAKTHANATPLHELDLKSSKVQRLYYRSIFSRNTLRETGFPHFHNRVIIRNGDQLWLLKENYSCP